MKVDLTKTPEEITHGLGQESHDQSQISFSKDQ